jgi:hypothetical protein
LAWIRTHPPTNWYTNGTGLIFTSHLPGTRRHGSQ